MTIRVQLFAAIRDAAEADALEIDLPDGALVRDLRDAIAARLPSVAALVAVSRLAIDRRFAADSESAPASAEFALIPPVSGG